LTISTGRCGTTRTGKPVNGSTRRAWGLGFGFGLGAGAGGVELGTGLEDVGWLELGGAGFDPLVQPLSTATPQQTPTNQTLVRRISPSNPEASGETKTITISRVLPSMSP